MDIKSIRIQALKEAERAVPVVSVLSQETKKKIGDQLFGARHQENQQAIDNQKGAVDLSNYDVVLVHKKVETRICELQSRSTFSRALAVRMENDRKVDDDTCQADIMLNHPFNKGQLETETPPSLTFDPCLVEELKAGLSRPEPSLEESYQRAILINMIVLSMVLIGKTLWNKVKDYQFKKQVKAQKALVLQELLQKVSRIEPVLSDITAMIATGG